MPDDFSHQQICAEMHAFGEDQVLGKPKCFAKFLSNEDEEVKFSVLTGKGT